MANLQLLHLDSYGPLNVGYTYRVASRFWIQNFRSLEIQLDSVGIHHIPAGIRLTDLNLAGDEFETSLDEVAARLYWTAVGTFYRLIFEWRANDMVVDPISEQDAHPDAACAMAGLNAVVAEMPVVIVGLEGKPKIWRP